MPMTMAATKGPGEPRAKPYQESQGERGEKGVNDADERQAALLIESKVHDLGQPIYVLKTFAGDRERKNIVIEQTPFFHDDSSAR